MSDTDTKLANAILSLVDELGQSRVIQQRMANTLVEIHTGQQQIIEQIRIQTERTNDVSKRTGESEGKIRLLDTKVLRHEERLQHIEARLPRNQSAAK